MLGITHTVVGVAAYSLIAGFDLPGLAVTTVMTRLPDVDIFIPGLHRGPTHSLLALLSVCAVSAATFPEFVLPVLVGYLSHLILDSLTVSGIPWLWPLRRRFGLPLFRTGSAGEGIFKWGAIALFLFLIF